MDNFTSRKKNKFIKDDYSGNSKNNNYKGFLRNKKKEYNLNKNKIIQDGLNNCKYKILKKYNINKDKNITRILVDI